MANGKASFLPDMSEGQAMLLNSIINGIGNGASAYGQSKQNDKNNALTTKGRREQNMFDAQSDAARAQMQMSMLDQNNQLTRDTQGMNASQLDPLAQQKSRAAFSLQGDKVSGWSPTSVKFDPESGMGSFSGGYNALRPSDHTKAMYSPEAAASAEMQDFRMPLAQLNPNLPIPDLTQVGLPNTKAYNAAELFRKGVFDQQEMGRRTERDAVQRAFQSVSDNQQALMDADKQGEQKKGGGFWKKLAKIGLIAGGGIATAMTGGAAAPLIGAAVGFGNGAIDGGLKGGLMGAGMGALSGGMGGGAASGVKAGLGSALKQTFSNPSNLLKMGGAVTPGAPGAAMTLAGSLARGRFNQPRAGLPSPAQVPNLPTPLGTAGLSNLPGGAPADLVQQQFQKFGKNVRFNPNG